MFTTLDRGVVLYGPGKRLHLIRTDSINGTYSFCNLAVQKAAADFQRPLCSRCATEADKYRLRGV